MARRVNPPRETAKMRRKLGGKFDMEASEFNQRVEALVVHGSQVAGVLSRADADHYKFLQHVRLD